MHFDFFFKTVTKLILKKKIHGSSNFRSVQRKDKQQKSFAGVCGHGEPCSHGREG